MRTFARLLLPCACALGLCAGGSAAIIYVSSSAGGPVHDGANWATGYLTVQEGVNAALPGDEVRVDTGVYAERLLLTSPRVRLTGGWFGGGIRQPGVRTTLRSPDPAFPCITILQSAVGAVVDGFHISGGCPGILTRPPDAVLANNRLDGNGSDAADGGGIDCQAPGPVTIADSLIEDNRARSGAGILVRYCEATIVRNTIRDNVAGGYLSAGSGGGIKVVASAVVVKDNVFARNVAIGYSADGTDLAASGAGMSVSSSQVIVANNTFTSNLAVATGRAEGGGLWVSGNGFVANNVFSGNTAGPMLGDGGARGGGVWVQSDPTVPPTILARGNVLFGNQPDDGLPTGVDGNRHADPLFIDPASDNYRLKTGSLAIDGGDNTFVSPGDMDLAQDPRILGAAVDAGAYESPNTPAPPALRRAYVHPDGDDRNDGASWATAKRSLGSALSVLLSGGEVWAAGGTYSERVTVRRPAALLGGFAGSETDARDARPRKQPTIIDAGGRGIAVTLAASAPGSVLDGFDVTGGLSLLPPLSGAGVVALGANATISRNRIHDNIIDLVGEASLLQALGAGLYAPAGPITVANNEFVDNTASAYAFFSATVYWPFSVSQGAGAYVADTDVRVVNNLFAGNRGAAFSSSGGGPAQGTGLFALDCTGLIANNTLVRNVGEPWQLWSAAQASALAVRSGADGLTVANNIVAFNSDGVDRLGQDVSLFLANDVYGNTFDPRGVSHLGGTGNMTLDPALASLPGGDYRLQPVSPLLDAGAQTVVSALGSTDLDGLPRVVGAVDLGAYERQASPPLSVADAAAAMRVAAGLATATGSLYRRLNVVEPETSAITLRDAIMLLKTILGG